MAIAFFALSGFSRHPAHRKTGSMRDRIDVVIGAADQRHGGRLEPGAGFVAIVDRDTRPGAAAGWQDFRRMVRGSRDRLRQQRTCRSERGCNFHHVLE
jgi:hypothetical protein